MAAPAECHLCAKPLPLGGVLDDVGRPVHAWCKGLAKLETAALAKATAKRVAREGRPVQKAALDRSVFSEATLT